MGLFDKRSAYEKEWDQLMKREQLFWEKHQTKEESALNKKIEEHIPEKLQETLEKAFLKAFTLVFEKGSGIIEKTYQKDKIEQDYKVNQYANEVKQNRKTLRAFSKKAETAGKTNLVLSGVSGVGLGVLGIGIPDIPLFTAMIFRNIYEIALHYGFGYESKEEQYFILLLIKGAVSYGEAFVRTDQEVERFIATEQCPEQYEEKKVLEACSKSLSGELLYMKFLQGIPIVGAVGGAYDAIYMKQIAAYGKLKYKKRFLQNKVAKKL